MASFASLAVRTIMIGMKIDNKHQTAQPLSVLFGNIEQLLAKRFISIGTGADVALTCYVRDGPEHSESGGRQSISSCTDRRACPYDGAAPSISVLQNQSTRLRFLGHSGQGESR
jgi:hypothetical protein